MNVSLAQIDLLDAERHIREALLHPAFSDWLKQALRSALERDPVALANDLELLGHLLRPWAAAHMASAHEVQLASGVFATPEGP